MVVLLSGASLLVYVLLMLRGGRGPLATQVRVVAAGLVLVVCASACSAAPTEEPAGQASAAPSNVVGEEGLELAVGDAVLTFAPGSATGAEVSAEEVAAAAAPARVPYEAPADAKPSAGAGGLADGVSVVPLSKGVAVSLDDGDSQPSAPVQVSFTLPDELLDDDDDETGVVTGLGVRDGNVALAVLSDDGLVELVPAVFNKTTATVTGDVPHFSSVWPVSIDFSWVIDTVLQGIGVTSPQPSCDGQAAQIGAATYSTVSQPQMWVCLDAAGESLKVAVTPNAPTPFVATPSVAATRFEPGVELSTASVLAAAVTSGSGLMPEGSVAVFPGGTTSLVYDDPAGSFSVDFDSAPSLYVVQILSEVVGVLFGVSGVDLARKMAGLECLAQIIPAGLGFGNEGLDPEDVAGISKSFFACAGPMIEELGGSWPPQVEVLFAILSTGPQLLVGGILGALTTATGLASSTAPIDAVVSEDVLEPGQVAAFIGTWHGPVDQDGSDYSVEVTLRTAAAGKLRASVRYPELDCVGYWTSPRLEGSMLSMVEHITPGDHTCALEVDIDVSLNEDGTELSYSASGGVATATLTRGKLPAITDTGGGAGAWPTGKDEAPPALYVWFGANGYNLPDWVACDDADDWCAAGQGDGEDVVVIDLSGNRISDVGSVTVSSIDPVAELTFAGVPARSAQQIVSAS